jgi:hypothetical protein
MGVSHMNIKRVELVKLEPSEGLYLKNINTNDVYEGSIFLAKSLTINDFEEIDKAEYDAIVAEQQREAEEYDKMVEAASD